MSSVVPLVSVLLPVRNSERTLGKALGSVLSQQFTDFEVLVIDDASTDDSPAIARSFNDRRVAAVRNQDRLGLSASLNRGLEKATGKYVARMDSDDVCHPERLGRQVACMEAEADLGVLGTWVRTFPRKEVWRFPERSGVAHAQSLFRSPVAHPSVMLRRALFEDGVLRYDESLMFAAEDWDLWRRASRVTKVRSLPAVLLDYHVGEPRTGDLRERKLGDANTVIERLLLELGLTPSHEEIELHREIGLADLTIERVTLDQVHRWLGILLEANARSRIYPVPELEEVVSRAWFDACYQFSSLGLESIRHYVSSPHARPRKIPLRDMTKFIIGAGIRRAQNRPET